MSRATVPALIEDMIAAARAKQPDRPALIGVAGAQGSGKTTAVEALTHANARYAQFSIDDVYFDTAQRAAFAARTHPLFVTRGPPGTHDIALARATIDALTNAGPDTATPLPRFDKIADRLRPREAWPLFRGRPEAILIDAWCLGALPPAGVGAPLNPVEEEDGDGVWRRTQDDLLRGAYGDWFASFDAMLYLRPPSWEIVRRWRGQQEVTLRKRTLTADEEAWIDRFIMHYERITRSMMDGRHSAAIAVQLDEARNIERIERR
ncbi:MAG: kinase [Hyphomonadaceae bacterium]